LKLGTSGDCAIRHASSASIKQGMRFLESLQHS
jgi:hypothetical protein